MSDTEPETTRATHPEEESEEETSEIQMGGRLMIDLSRGAYSSFATAIKEYVSNGWDAGAGEVIIRVYNPDEADRLLVEVVDNGSGMTREDLQTKFFRLGRDRRKEEGDIVETIRGTRRIHGRKGLGNLAGLRVAGVLEVITWRREGIQGARLALEEIENAPNEIPRIHWFTPKGRPESYDSGTVIRLVKHARKQAVDMANTVWNLRLWFEFKEEMKVTLEHRKGTPEDSQPVKDWNIARSELLKGRHVTEEVKTVTWEEDGEKHQESVTLRWAWLERSRTDVRSLISVVSGNRALSTAEDFDYQRGWTNMFGVYKLLGEMHADWIDQMEDFDPADLRREGVNWDIHPSLEALREIGRQWVREVCRKMAGSRKGIDELRERARKIIAERPQLRRMPQAQRRRLVSLVTRYASEEGLSVRQLDKVIDVFAFILQHGALLQFLEQLKKGERRDLRAFLETADNFTAAEITNLLQVTRSKLDLLKKLKDLITDPETLEVARAGRADITSFLAKNPWIFDPELSISHLNISMKRIVLEADGTSTEDLNKLPAEFFYIRPDLVTYKGPSERPWLIELKAPTHEMTEEEALRVVRYNTALKQAGLRNFEIITVSGTYSPSARATLTETLEARVMDYGQVLQRGINQLQDYIDQLQEGLDGLLGPEER